MDWPAFSCAPTFGSSTKTTSPSSLLRVIGDADGAGRAFNLDPLVLFGIAKVRWIHTCSLAKMSNAAAYLGPLVKRQRDDARRRGLAANTDFDFGPDGGLAGGT